ncbi:MAG: helix-turn-helix domain-containing protein [Myxococcota bacterium]
MGHAADTGRKAQILATAAALLKRAGYRGTTVADIAEEARISVGSVYLEFSGKDAIIAELSRECFTHVLREIDRAVADAESGPRALQVAFEVRTLELHRQSASAPFAKELLHCGACSAVADSARAFARQELERVQRILEAGEKAEEFELIDRADVVAGTLLRLLDRLGPTHESTLTGRSLEREIERAVELLVRSVLA